MVRVVAVWVVVWVVVVGTLVVVDVIVLEAVNHRSVKCVSLPLQSFAILRWRSRLHRLE